VSRWLHLAHHYSEAAAQAAPEAVAVRCRGGDELSYGELASRSNRLARALRSLGVGRQGRVALCLGRGANSIVAMLGTLKADAIYVPIHERSPADRIRAILQDCTPDAIVVDRKTVDLALASLGAAGCPPALVLMGEPPETPAEGVDCVSQAEIDAESGEPPACANVDTDLAYLLYTSGSTGRPKGVMVSHLNIANYAEWALGYLHLVPEDRILGTAPLHFDMSTFDVYATQRSGARLCLAGEAETLFPVRLVKMIEEEGITLWKGVSSLLAYMVRTGAVSEGRLPSLTRVLFAGERLPTPALIAWMQAFPEKRFFNAYGPTETTGVSAIYEIEGAPAGPEATIPIGQACANSEILVLNEEDRLVAPGEQGEICIRGSALGRGYWNDPEKTRLAFQENPVSPIPGDRLYRTGDLGYWRADGQLLLVGRKDEQVKWMGYRIELGEITMAAQALPGVADAATLLLDGREGEDLVCFVVLAGADPKSVMTGLRERLPSYMVPRRLVPLDAIPLSDRGKVDREALRQRDLTVAG